VAAGALLVVEPLGVDTALLVDVDPAAPLDVLWLLLDPHAPTTRPTIPTRSTALSVTPSVRVLSLMSLLFAQWLLINGCAPPPWR
jgi:hypothetical protein